MTRLIIAAASLLGCIAVALGSEAPKPAVAMGLLKANCLGCHNAEKKKGGLSLETREAALKGGENGAAFVEGRSDRSPLVKALSDDGDSHMPPKKRLTDKQMAVLQAWVDGGAHWDLPALRAFGEVAPAARLGELPAVRQPVVAIALSPDGAKLAISQDNTVVVRDVSQPDLPVVATLKGHRDLVQSLAWSGDGKKLAAGGYRSVLVWETNGWTNVAEMGAPLEGRVTALAFLSDHETLVMADGAQGEHGLLQWWKIGDPKPGATVEAHRDNILSLVVGHLGKLLATGGADDAVKVWDAATHQELARLEGHTQHVLALAFNKDDTWLATGGADKDLKIWNISTKEQLIQLGRHETTVTGLYWTADGTQLVAVGENGKPKVYSEFVSHSGAQSTETAKERKLNPVDGILYNVVATADAKGVFAGADDGTVWRWQEAKQSPIPPPASAAQSAVGTPPAPGAAPVAASSFTNDILPILSKAGCNMGSCHAKASGQAGFKLSIFAYDPRSDYQQITRNSRARRVFPALPEESLLLRKATARMTHEGGQRFELDSAFGRTLVHWIRQGMPYETPGEAKLVRIEAIPPEKTYAKGASQQLQVIAHYSDGSSRNVSYLADYQSNEKGVATVNEAGLVAAGSYSGEAVIIARYMGMVAISQVNVPADRLLPEDRYASLPITNDIDRLVYARLKKLAVLPSEGCTDAEFLRRSSLDAIGVLPSVEEARAFLDSKDGEKRDHWIDHLLSMPGWADHWSVRFSDLLRPNPSRVGVKPVFLFDDWIREALRSNKPWDQIVREIMTAQGSSHQDGRVAVWRDKREPEDMASFAGRIFLGIRMECAKCHHHPSERWDQSDYFQFAAFFTRMKRKGQGISAPISGEPEYWWFGPGAASIAHPVTNASLKPRAPGAEESAIADADDPRKALMDWMTRPDNPFFAKAIVNRIWSAYFGRGIVDPVDDFRASNPPSNGPLLDWLAADFIDHHFDLKHLMRRIMRSHAYQLSTLPNGTNVADTRNYSRSYRRRLPAEVLLDAVSTVTGVQDEFLGCAPGTRAVQTWNVKLESEFLDAFGRPNSSAECPCERDAKPSVVQALHLMNSTKLQAKLGNEQGRALRLAKSALTPEQIVEELYLATYSRKPEPDEAAFAAKAFLVPASSRQGAVEDVLWALLNSAEFVFNH